MRNSVTTALLALLLATPLQADDAPFGIAIHGGAGTIKRENMPAQREALYHAKLKEALEAGNAILSQGGDSLDAVIAAIVILEDSPLFNAGKGAVYTFPGEHELDASLMRGSDLAAGAVAGVKDVRNPIRLAREVMENSPHVMLSGAGASEFADERGLDKVRNNYFDTPHRLEAWRNANAGSPDKQASLPIEYKFGTVGAVALDKHGNIAAGTSTGGMTNKRWGRIGDSPVIGAGTYANNASCAVSATGHGEFFIRYTVAHDICARMQYGGATLDDATAEVIEDVLMEAGGGGGVVAIDAQGNMSLRFNSKGMYRGYTRNGETPVTAIYR